MDVNVKMDADNQFRLPTEICTGLRPFYGQTFRV